MSDATKLPSPAQMLAIARESLTAKDKATMLHAPIKERKKSFYEVGNGNPKAMSLLESLLKIHGNNEIRADDTAAHCQQALDIYREHTKDAGHVGNLADMANAASAEDDEGEGAETAAKADPNLVTAPGGLPHDESLKRFEANLTKSANRTKAAKALDLPAVDPAAKPKRGGKKTAVVSDADTTEASVPPPPPEDEDDLKPAFLRREEEKRAAEPEAAGTFARVH